jgi:anti-anti-sigma factor
MSATPNRLVITDHGSCSVGVSGEIDAHSAPMLAERLSGCSGAETDIVIDLSGVTFMDSSGLRVLIDIRQRLEATPHRLVLASPSDSVIRLLEVAGLDGHFTLDR